MCKRGEVYYVVLPIQTVKGSSIQAGIRPAVIVQNDIGNKFSPTLIIVPLTKELKKPNQPTHVIVKEEGLAMTSMVLAEQFTTINKFDIRGELVCTLPESTMKQIDKAIRASLGITEQADSEYIMSILRDIKLLEHEIREADHDNKLMLNGTRQGLLNVLKRYCDKFGVDYLKFVKLIQNETKQNQSSNIRVAV